MNFKITYHSFDVNIISERKMKLAVYFSILCVVYKHKTRPLYIKS